MVSRRRPILFEKPALLRIPSSRSPLGKSPHKTRIERDGAITATRALIQVTTERGGAAALNGGQYFQMQPVKPGAASIDEALSCGADHVGHLQRWPFH